MGPLEGRQADGPSFRAAAQGRVREARALGHHHAGGEGAPGRTGACGLRARDRPSPAAAQVTLSCRSPRAAPGGHGARAQAAEERGGAAPACSSIPGGPARRAADGAAGEGRAPQGTRGETEAGPRERGRPSVRKGVPRAPPPRAPRPHTHSVPTRGAATGSGAPGGADAEPRARPAGRGPRRPPEGPGRGPAAAAAAAADSPSSAAAARLSRAAGAQYPPRRRPSRSKSRWVTGRGGGTEAAIVPPSRPGRGGGRVPLRFYSYFCFVNVFKICISFVTIISVLVLFLYFVFNGFIALSQSHS